MKKFIEACSDMKSYKKEQRCYIRKMKKLLKDSGPFDGGFMLDVIRAMLERRLEYFSLGHNVWQVDESRLKIVEELKTCAELFRHAEEDFDEDYKSDVELNNDPVIEAAEKKKLLDFYKRQESKQHKALQDAVLYFADHINNWWD